MLKQLRGAVRGRGAQLLLRSADSAAGGGRGGVPENAAAARGSCATRQVGGTGLGWYHGEHDQLRDQLQLGLRAG